MKTSVLIKRFVPLILITKVPVLQRLTDLTDLLAKSVNRKRKLFQINILSLVI